MKKPHGFTLIELVIAMAILLTIFPSTMLVFQRILSAKFLNESRIITAYLAQGVFEHYSQRRFTAVDDVPLTLFSSPNIGSGTDPNPFFNSEFGQYSFQVDVECIRNTGAPNIDDWPTVVCTPAEDYKRVVVRVFFETFGSITLTALFTDTRDP